MGMLSPTITLRGRELFFEFPVFLAQLLGIDGVLYQDECLVDGERLFQEVVGAQLGRAHRGFNGAVAGDHDDLGSILQLPDLLQSLQAVHAGQPDIEQHHVEGALAQGVQAGFAALRRRTAL